MVNLILTIPDVKEQGVSIKKIIKGLIMQVDYISERNGAWERTGHGSNALVYPAAFLNPGFHLNKPKGENNSLVDQPHFIMADLLWYPMLPKSVLQV